MRVAVISDIHDQWDNLDKVLEDIQGRRVVELWVLGDLCSPPTLRQIGQSGLTSRVILGNNDGDHGRLLGAAAEFGSSMQFTTSNFAEYEIGGRRAFVSHYPEIARLAALSGEYVAAFYGHDHVAHWEKLSSGCLLANPGEVWGYKTGSVSYGLWDSQSNQFEIIEV